jgi:hypothetical protein
VKEKLPSHHHHITTTPFVALNWVTQYILDEIHPFYEAKD